MKTKMTKKDKNKERNREHKKTYFLMLKQAQQGLSKKKKKNWNNSMLRR